MILEILCYEKNACGLNFDGYTDTLILAYADGLIILKNYPVDVKCKLDLLKDYCIRNALTIIAIRKVKGILCKAKSKSWKEKIKFLDSTIDATFLYASEVWSQWHYNIIKYVN